MIFLLGVLLGMVLLGSCYVIYDTNKTYALAFTPIYNFLEVPISEIIFESRKGHLVTLKYQNYIIYLSLDKREVYISEGGEIKYVNSKYNEQECVYLYNRLLKAFNTEINLNILDYNGVTVSNNLIKESNTVVDVESYDYVPNLDDILDKISESGLDSLTKSELDILKGQSDK